MSENTENTKESKRKFALWTKDSTIRKIEKYMAGDNCKSVSEFINRAVEFYLGYITTDDNRDYVSSILVQTLKGIVKDSENRQAKLQYKMAVEMAIMMNLIATWRGVDKVNLEKLRGVCEKEVRKLNGVIDFDTAVYWQEDVRNS